MDVSVGKTPALPFPVVGIGASAGGVEALTQLFQELPTDTGMAFVLVQHLDPRYPSLLPEILGRATRMPVMRVDEGDPVEPDRVYVIPPGAAMQIREGALHLSPRAQSKMQYRGIDLFLRTLALDQRHLAIGVILSGTSSDGTLGVAEIKAEGGVTFAQDESAIHPEMPRSAVLAGAIDFELPPAGIAGELARIARHPYVRAEALPGGAEISEAAFNRVLQLLLRTTSVDFGLYKRTTLFRRMQRRALLQKAESFDDYVQLLEKSPAELEALFHDVLINVTSFFRDPEAFDALKSEVFPRLTADRSHHDSLRVWSLGCSTGEEAYSIAIAYHEFADATGCQVPLQLFATDLNGAGIERARSGIYPRTIAQDVSEVRLRRFFTEIDGSYRISKEIRDACVFAQHNVLAAPPFSHMGLVSCRNLLIYLEARAQQRLIPLLHYALKPEGFLWLGDTEGIGSYRDLFELSDARHKIYLRRSGSARAAHRIPLSSTPAVAPALRNVRARETALPSSEADRVMLGRYAPPAVVINDELEVLQFRGDTGNYLAPAPGRATLSLINMLRPGLRVPVRSAIFRAKKDGAVAHADAVRIRGETDVVDLVVEVVPLAGGTAGERHFLVIFDESRTNSALRLRVQQAEGAARQAESTRSVASPELEISQLSAELASTREVLQAVIEQQEAANEELQAANEEVQSANEELQSTNEELETSKEEIQSSNEELATVNDALQGRNLELSQANNDFVNLLASVQMAIVMLGPDLKIRRFTPAAEKMLNLISTDVGRPIADIRLRVEVADFEKLLNDVMDTMSPHEVEVQDKDRRWFSMRIRPYRTMENRIEGVVVVLVDVDSLKRGEQTIRASAERLRLVQHLAPVGIFEADAGGRLLEVNDRLSRISGHGHDELLRRELSELIYGEDVPALQALFAAATRKEGTPQLLELRLRRKDTSLVWVEISCAAQRAGYARDEFFIGTVQDITERRENERALRETEARFHALADSAPVLIWVNGLDGCEFVNRAYREHVGVPDEELLGMAWANFVHPEDREPYIAAYRQAAEEAAPFQSQLRFRRADGSYRWMKSIALPRFDPRGQLTGYVGSSFDVHDLKVAESSLRDADRRKNEFLAMLAHELRNPLAPLRNIIELLRDKNLQESELDWAREIMDRQVEAMSRMIEDLLDVSRITQGKIQLRLEPHDLAPLFQRLAQGWRPRVEKAGLIFETSLPAKPVMALIDAVRLEQVIGNLLGNAVKFTPPGGKVRLECDDSDPEWVTCRVRDTGKGIAADELPRIFDLFMQSDHSLSRTHGGLGIGLTLVQRLMDLHGGTVEARSDGDGLGAEFSLRLPRLAASPTRAESEARSRRGNGSNGNPRRILVVDDNVDGALSWAMLLRLQGHDVEVSHDGLKALESAKAFEPEVALVDIGLPGMDGIELGRRLREASPGLLLIAVSGYAGEEDRAKTRAAGFDHHFRKPLEPDVLFEIFDRNKS